MIKVLIAPNSFKECAYSTAASQLISDSFNKYVQNKEGEFEFVQFPISDGGDGFLNVIKKHFTTETIYYEIESILGSGLFSCPVEYSKEKETVYIESAKAIGLGLIPAGQRDPLVFNSAPLGDLLNQINHSDLKIENVIIGIGGTATNDLGTGVLSHFGLKLFDNKRNELAQIPQNFLKVFSLEIPEIKLNFGVQIVVDVENELLGETGASNVFAGQKGASPDEILLMEKGFQNLISRFRIEKEAVKTLSGAGGGIAAAFQLFFSAKVVTAEEFILNSLDLRAKKMDFQLVITGEGSVDNQTLMNKGAMIIYNYFKLCNVKVCFICGENKLDKIPELLEIFELKNYFNSSKESIKRFPEAIELVCKEIAEKHF